MEATIEARKLEIWRRQEREWEESVLHLEETLDLVSPYELNKQYGEWSNVLIARRHTDPGRQP